MFFLPFSLATLTELCSFWYGSKDLFPLHKLNDKVFLVTVKTEHVPSSTRDLYGCGLWVFSGEWVKALLPYNLSKMNGKNRKIRRLRGNLPLLIVQPYMYIIFTCTLTYAHQPYINGCHCPVNSAGRTLICPAVECRFKLWSNQQPGP